MLQDTRKDRYLGLAKPHVLLGFLGRGLVVG